MRVQFWKLVCCASAIIGTTHAHSGEPDVRDLAKVRPAKVYVDNKVSEWGDPFLKAAIEALDGLPSPWTVPMLIRMFDEESSVWLLKLDLAVLKKQTRMWDGADAESKRCGHLAILLAASRDPRAALVLGKYLKRPESPGGISIIQGLYRYFVGEERYLKASPDEIPHSFHFFREMTATVEAWWRLNREQVECEAFAVEHQNASPAQ